MKAVDENQKAYSALKSEVAKKFKLRNVPPEVLEQAAKEVAEEGAKKSTSLLSKAGNAIKAPFKAVGKGIKGAGKRAGSAIGKHIPQGVKTAGSKAKGLLKTSGAGFMLAIDVSRFLF